jgi:ribosomal protein L7/L12
MNESWAVPAAVAAVAVCCAIYYTATAWFKHRERMAMIEQGLNPDQMPPTLPLSDRVKELASDPTKKIEAIKVHREETGASLAQAKQAVDAFTTGKQG